MLLNKIECTNCGTVISLTDALSSELKDHYKNEFQKIISKREDDLLKKEMLLTQEKDKLVERKIALDKKFNECLSQEKKLLEKTLRSNIQDETKIEIDTLNAQLEYKSKLLADAQGKELNLRIQLSEVEEQRKSLDLEVQRRIDGELKLVEEKIKKEITDEMRLKTNEKDKQLDDMRRQITELKRKSEEGSQKIQGEVLEMEIENILKNMFPMDSINPVPNGFRGGDIVQKVTTNTGKEVGTILWETKRTKLWNDNWITKLKEDQRTISAEAAVIVTQILPKDISGIGFLDGVWIADFSTFAGLAIALRSGLFQIFQAKISAVNKGEKMDSIYNYLTGAQFKQRVEVIVESFISMRAELEKEKRITHKNWAIRDKQLAKLLESTTGIYGDIQGLMGACLPKIPLLEIEEIREDEAADTLIIT